jgi:Glucose-6-phosphate dehydrogenase, C-terminal domain
MRKHIALSVTVLLIGFMLCACATTEPTSQGPPITSESAVMTTASPPPVAAQGSPQAALFRREEYVAGTWGPQEADELLERDGRQWRRING